VIEENGRRKHVVPTPLTGIGDDDDDGGKYLPIEINAYHSRCISEGVAEISQIFLRETHILPKLLSYEKCCKRDRY
jgi:hypothetical protein